MMVRVPTRSGNTLRFPWAAPDPSTYRTYQWNILEAFRAQNISLYVHPVFFGYELKLLISTAGGRFPRAWLAPPCASHSGVSRLMLFPQESPPSVSINGVVFRTTKGDISYSLDDK